MRILLTVLLPILLLTTGCLSSGRGRAPRDEQRNPEPPITDNRAWWDVGDRGRGNSRNLPTETARTDKEGIIAGEIFDLSNNKRLTGLTFIQVRLADDAAPARGRGTGVETDNDGYFYMAGLIPGKTYILSAVREQDGRKIAGEVQVKPPASRVRIEVSENKVSSVTPLPHPPIGATGPFADPNDSPAGLLPPPPLGGSGWAPGAAPSSPPPSGTRPSVTRPENIAGIDGFRPPTASIRPPPESVPSRKPLEDSPHSNLGRAPYFAISDIDGRDWDLREANGRLVLLEFWSTSCAPCMRAVPMIKKLQTDYNSSGLEVVALALEGNAPLNERLRNIEEVARQKQMNYRVFVEREGKVDEVPRLFGIKQIPTLILLDRKGNILWRGGVSDTDFDRLDDTVRRYLTKRD